MSESASLLALTDVTKVYRAGTLEVTALHGVSLNIERGEWTALLGPSGSGKSTLLHIIGCLDSPSSGEYLLDGVSIHTLKDAQLAEIRNRKIGFVFQSFNLLPRLTAIQNVELPLSYSNVPRAERLKRSQEALKSVSLDHREDHRPSQLSGGERQRVAIARALVTRPSVILADEPTGNLDSKVGGEILDLFEQLNRDLSVTVIIVTHDRDVGSRCRRRISMRDGAVVSDER